MQKITPSGVVSTLAGSVTAGAANGTGGSASFNWPVGVAVDASGNVFVGDNLNDGAAATVAFSNPAGVAVDSSGNVYVADSGDNKVRKIR